MNVAPFGVFCLIAKNFANIGFDAFLPMLKYMLSVFIALGGTMFCSLYVIPKSNYWIKSS